MMTAGTVLAIDQGTTSTKAFVLTEDGGFSAIGSIAHRQILPQDGHVEHDPDEIVQAVETLIDRALDRHADVAAIALANQGETVVAFDRITGAPLHNAIVWQDQRTEAWLRQLPDASRDMIRARAGLPADSYFSASKLAWLLHNVPSVVDAARQGRLGIGTSDTFLLHRLTGSYATDATTASRSSLMNLATRTWDDELCDLFGLPRDLLPPIRPTRHGFGAVRRGGREIPVTVSVVDQQASLFGHGCRVPGDVKITFGTGSFALAITGDTPVFSATGLVPTVAWALSAQGATYALEGGDYTAAAAVDWCIAVGLGGSLAAFDFEDAAPAVGSGLVFVPALAGLAAPHWRRDIRAAFMGMTQATRSADMRKALLEGIAFRGAELIEALCGPGNAPISVDGGLVANRYFVQVLANALARPVRQSASADLTGFGAAMLARGGAGLADSAPSRLIFPDGHSGAVRSGRSLFDAAVRAAGGFAHT